MTTLRHRSTTMYGAALIHDGGLVATAGTVVLVTSVSWLKASDADFALHVEALIPKHNHELQTSERTLAPAWMALPELIVTRDYTNHWNE